MSDWFGCPKPLIIAHRGASASAPENSLTAFLRARDEGADGIELDVRLSADGVPFVIHDSTVDRTTDASGRVNQLTSDQLGRLLVDGHQPVPTLDTILGELGASTLYNIELKTSRWRDSQLIAEVLYLFGHHQLEKKVLFSSFNPLIVRDIRAQSRNTIPAALIRSKAFLKLGLNLSGAAADHPGRHLITQGYMKWANNRQVHVHVWTVDNLQEAERFVRLGVKAVITNDPELLVEADLHW